MDSPSFRAVPNSAHVSYGTITDRQEQEPPRYSSTNHLGLSFHPEPEANDYPFPPPARPRPSLPAHSHARVSFAEQADVVYFVIMDDAAPEYVPLSASNPDFGERASLLSKSSSPDSPRSLSPRSMKGILRKSSEGFPLHSYDPNKPLPRPPPNWGQRLTIIAGVLFATSIFATALLGGPAERRIHRPPRFPGSQSPFDLASPLSSTTSSGSDRNPAYLIKAQSGAVASEHETCSQLGVDLLKAGGSAVDAAIGSTLCTGVLNMFSSGIGGGGFLTVRIPPPPHARTRTAEAFNIDFRETAPVAANSTMFGSDDDADEDKYDPDVSRYGGLSVAVPGEVRGLWEAHQRWGRLDWESVVAPSAKLAREFKVGKELARRLQIEKNSKFIMADPTWRALFAPNGTMVVEGDLISRPNYAKTLEAIGKYGPDAFYTGSIANSISAKVLSAGGILTPADMAAYSVDVTPALIGSYRGRTLYTTHAPTSGPVLLHILNLMERFDLVKEGRTGLNVHRMIEGIKFGFAARTRLGDPKFHNETHIIDEIATKRFAERVAPKITDDATHPLEYYRPLFDIVNDYGTTHISALDHWGMAISITSSVNLVFGSRVLDEETGVLMNDVMDDFSRPGVDNAFGLRSSPYNYPGPNKRPLSSMAPTIMEHTDGTFYAALGASGGSRIFSAVAQALLNLDWGMDVSAAVERARVHDQLIPVEVSVESGMEEGIVRELKGRGHNVTLFDVNMAKSEVQAIVSDREGRITAASDSRKNGVAAGY
ncbi:hypothetical protein BOTBODRAFT_58281 [Botryobasidium botryosum FD-172 SS1]|uniref:Glutathione hydrolase n=1 Tax=Botryobasidium botryosum (strain FD-172 SS1) TaxID=930990 RepID=A0A067M2Q0_BOTB1|nr:hypothetical protein BOTBODRAFT_58281 [Botryobasidium botryosum FD-172 SS1]